MLAVVAAVVDSAQTTCDPRRGRGEHGLARIAATQLRENDRCAAQTVERYSGEAARVASAECSGSPRAG